MKAAEKAGKAPKIEGKNGVSVADPNWVREHVPFCGEAYVGHVRYGTDSENSIDKCHPVTRESNWMTRRSARIRARVRSSGGERLKRRALLTVSGGLLKACCAFRYNSSECKNRSASGPLTCTCCRRAAHAPPMRHLLAAHAPPARRQRAAHALPTPAHAPPRCVRRVKGAWVANGRHVGGMWVARGQ